MLSSALWLFNQVIGLVMTLVIVSAILSWLVAFDVINLRNRLAYNIVRTLDAIVEPILRPIRRIMPNLGGVDISPIILLLLLGFLQRVVNNLALGAP
jgi:YggT family protein